MRLGQEGVPFVEGARGCVLWRGCVTKKKARCAWL